MLLSSSSLFEKGTEGDFHLSFPSVGEGYPQGAPYTVERKKRSFRLDVMAFCYPVQIDRWVLVFRVMSNDDSLLTFPITFPIKVMGVQSDSFEQDMVMIARKYAPDLDEAAVRCKPSNRGNYLALTLTIEAQSREQIDNIYRELTARPDVKMVL